MNDTLNYAMLYRIARSVLEGAEQEPDRGLAEEIARRVAESGAGVEAIRVRVRKPEVPLKRERPLGATVEIERRPRIDYP